MDEKERGIADNLAALAAGDLIAAWKLEAAPRKPDRLLKVKVEQCTFHGLYSTMHQGL